MFGPVMGACTTGEPNLGLDLTKALGPGMLVFADRGFCAHPLFPAFAATGADLCWRAKANAVLPVLARHPDGSYASELVASDDKRARRRVTPVRVVEYEIADPGRPQAETTRYRLVTTILDPHEAPAHELAALYAQHWQIESALEQPKSHHPGPRAPL